AAIVVNKLAARLNSKMWDGDETAIVSAYTALITPETIDDALADRLCRFELRGLQIRSLDSHIYRLCGPTEFARDWKVVSGNGQIIAAPDGATYLKYDFASSSDAPISLRYEFDLPDQFKP